jgi:2'-5' RNA ligase
LSPAAKRGERGRRLFFALWPGESVRARLAAWSRELQELCGGRVPLAQDLHLTLAFLGQVPEGRIDEVERAAQEVLPQAATLILDRPGFWKHNRIAWAGASSIPAELEGLVRGLREALTRFRIAFDPKPFVPHVTLLREAREPRTLPALEPIRWDLDGFVLVGPSARGGGRYEVIRTWETRR